MRSGFATIVLAALLVPGLACAAAGQKPPTAAEQAYPVRPIRFIVPFPPGGGTDILSRLVAHELTESEAGGADFWTTGNGTVGHLSGELCQWVTGVRLVHVPYKGSAQAFPDLLGGRVNAFLASLETAIRRMKAGAVLTLAITSAQRVPALPDLPTVAEPGYPGFETATWYGVLVARGVPRPLVSRLAAEITRVLDSADVKMAANGGATVKPGPAAFDALIRSETRKWSRVISEAGVKIE